MTRRVLIAALAVAGALAGPATLGAQGPPPIPTVAPPPPPVVPALEAAPAPPVVRHGRVAPGVSIAGVDVADLTRQEARAKVIAERVVRKRAPVVALFRGRRVPVSPVRAGYVADVDYAVKAAMAFGRSHRLRPSVDVPLRERISRPRLRAILRHHASRLDVAPRDASIRFQGSRPIVTTARAGTRIDLRGAERRVVPILLERSRSTVTLPAQRVRPAVTQAPPAVLIERSRFRLTLFRGGTRETFGISVGQPAFPTPAGTFHIVSKQVNPTWFPPNSPWAAGLGPQPPGVDNPLGTRWMGTSAPAIGIHGTPNPGSIGSAASHGCIRMRISQAEYLFDRIDIGTPVKIV